MLSYMFAEVVSTAVMPQEDAREEAEYDEIRHEEATGPDSLYANNSFLQDIGSAAAGCETNSRGACAESRDNVLYSVAQLPKDQIKPTGQSQRNQSESAENDSFYDLSRSRLKSVTSEQTLSNSLRSAAGLQTLVHDEQKNSAGNGKKLTMLMPQEALWIKREPVQNILLIAVCWLILLAIMGLLTLILESDPNQLKENSTLLAINTKLSLENTNLTRDNKNLTDQLDNLTQAYNVSESNNKNLSAGVKELETKNNILTEKIQNMETNWNELNAAIKKKALDLRIWIGLRVVNKQWKWVDGSDLTDSSWIDLPDPVDGRCAVFYKGRDTWSSVSCSD
ncbi:hypothetical protein F7725_017834 [Dissostichus mawsoni]|uniref:C-type lectin domain-containing protein n=1 Tax=Dissostichus mawsoni TaxID=36200 RepID=A0A7J5XRC6_DISMA|nr:hypothetical protein F7725_017834 [Dissostichus mawsoni]